MTKTIKSKHGTFKVSWYQGRRRNLQDLSGLSSTTIATAINHKKLSIGTHHTLLLCADVLPKAVAMARSLKSISVEEVKEMFVSINPKIDFGQIDNKAIINCVCEVLTAPSAHGFDSLKTELPHTLLTQIRNSFNLPNEEA